MFLYNFILRFFRFIIVRIIGLRNILLYNIEYLKLKYFLNQKKILNIVYDLSCQSMAIGNFSMQLFFARYFSLKNVSIKIIIINEKIKDNFRSFKEREIFYKNFRLLAEATIPSNLLEFRFSTWEYFTEYISQKSFYKKNYILEKNKILNRKSTNLGNLINKLTIKEEDNFMSKYLFDKNYFINLCSKKVLRLKNKEYISFIVRYDKKVANGKKNSISRNINKKNLLTTIINIRKKFPENNILLVSDEAGCQKAKLILRKYSKSDRKKIFYSKDYKTTIIEDIFLLTNSKCVILNPYGGGTLEYVRMSKTPFFFTNHLSKILLIKTRQFFNRHSRAYWWNGPHNSQVYINSINMVDFINGLAKYNFANNKKYIYSKV